MTDERGNLPIGIVFPSGKARSSEDERRVRIGELQQRGFQAKVFLPENESADGFSAGTDAERAVLLCQALTLRSLSRLWVARGGYGSTALIKHLRAMLPPVLPDQTLVGFSDASFIGNILSLAYPNVKYIMGAHAFEKDFFAPERSPEWQADCKLTLDLLRGDIPEPVTLRTAHAALPPFERHRPEEIVGTLIPLNLSLAESLACFPEFRLPRAPIFFFEDINEDVYRLLRKIDGLELAGFFEHAEAIVLGEFKACPDEDAQNVTLPHLAKLIGERTGLPTYVLPVFGHDQRRFPLVAGSRVEIRTTGTGAEITLSFEKITERTALSRPAMDSSVLNAPMRDSAGSRVHFLGIGGTGMAAVAGLAKQAGFRVTGSDGPIYPPMSHVLAALEIKPFQGYQAENLAKAEPDLVVLANAISRVGATLTPNEEFEALLQSQTPLYSFPSFLRTFILRQSVNIVVAGTHGKTTTTSAIAHALREMGADPSYLIGGSPKNFDLGFHLGRKGVAVLEGDEYDTALFDKGPKFLHYEPKVALINNIEFDHADIYPNLEAITCEFERLAKLSTANRGLVVLNASDPVALALAENNMDLPIILFGDAYDAEEGAFPPARPLWLYLGHATLAAGSLVRLKTPAGSEIEVRTRLFGKHNALNTLASLAVLQAHMLTQEFESGLDKAKLWDVARELSPSTVERWADALSTFEGVKRRFELLHLDDRVAVFDDFAHHPTAIASTIEAFKDYHKVTERTGRLRICFDPRNATMRRRVLEAELAASLRGADEVHIGKVAVDMRIPENDRLNNKDLARALESSGTPAHAYTSPEDLLQGLEASTAPGDTVVFMSSGSFDGLPARFVEKLQSTQSGASA